MPIYNNVTWDDPANTGVSEILSPPEIDHYFTIAFFGCVVISSVATAFWIYSHLRKWIKFANITPMEREIAKMAQEEEDEKTTDIPQTPSHPEIKETVLPMPEPLQQVCIERLHSRSRMKPAQIQKELENAKCIVSLDFIHRTIDAYETRNAKASESMRRLTHRAQQNPRREVKQLQDRLSS